MDEAARHRAIEDFDQASWTYWTVILYGWDAKRARERELEEGGSDEDEETTKPITRSLTIPLKFR